jgi:hypothetical protein
MSKLPVLANACRFMTLRLTPPPACSFSTPSRADQILLFARNDLERFFTPGGGSKLLELLETLAA